VKIPKSKKYETFALLALAAPGATLAGGVPTTVLEEVIVTGKLGELHGEPVSASQGVVGEEQLAMRPVLRTGELMEVVPGLIVTQHSGDGKANQFFLRGFNLDHGTDLATSVDGVPVNMPTHGHGHGYTDLNFVIPELVQSLEYRKGAYYAESGDFSAAGAVDMRYRSELDGPLVVLEAGEDNYSRALLSASPEFGGGTLLLGVDYSQTDGPWLLEENFHKRNAIARYTRRGELGELRITAQGYDGEWRATDQIPLRAVEDGSLDRYGTVDPTGGGESHRYSLALDWDRALGAGRSNLNLYAVDYRLDLFSNFSYFIDGENGDQFEQLDDRRVYGGTWAWRSANVDAFGGSQQFVTGVQVRHDDIGRVGLYRAVARARFDTVREDSVRQTSVSTFAGVDSRWNDWLRSSIGLRADRFEFEVDASLAANSGKRSDSIVSPKLSLIATPRAGLDLFLNAGRGFHSNDARGATITVDPTDGVTPAETVDPLVDATAFDVGLRVALGGSMQASVSLWQLDLDSELLFVGDAGTTEPTRGSRRRGVEATLIWNPVSWLIVDADLAWSRSRFTDFDVAGDRIPGAVERVASVGVALDHPAGWFGGARFRHFGEAPLVEDNSVRSDPTTLLNIEAGYRFSDRYRLSAALYNVFGSRDNDITYFYESQLAGETEPVEDKHFHPVEPRTVRITFTASF
jgi:outer membrane receptor protein involved in Fe transport